MKQASERSRLVPMGEILLPAYFFRRPQSSNSARARHEHILAKSWRPKLSDYQPDISPLTYLSRAAVVPAADLRPRVGRPLEARRRQLRGGLPQLEQHPGHRARGLHGHPGVRRQAGKPVRDGEYVPDQPIYRRHVKQHVWNGYPEPCMFYACFEANRNATAAMMKVEQTASQNRNRAAPPKLSHPTPGGRNGPVQ